MQTGGLKVRQHIRVEVMWMEGPEKREKWGRGWWSEDGEKGKELEQQAKEELLSSTDNKELEKKHCCKEETKEK